MAQDNVDVIESAWEAFGKRDIDAVVAMFAPEAEIRAPESLPWGGTYMGPEGFRDFLERLMDNWEQFRVVPEKVLGADDDHVVVVARVNARGKSGNSLEGKAVWVYRMRGGQVIEAEVQTDTARMLEALG